MDRVVTDFLAALERGDRQRVRLLLHPYLHWVEQGTVLRGRNKVLDRLAADPPVAPPAAYELRDGQIYRWTVAPAIGGRPDPADPTRRFAELVEELVAAEGVEPPGAGSGFGAGALRVRGKIFAMLVRDRLVVKLPKARVDALVESGEGTRWDANKGTPMKEWLALDAASGLDWLALAREALAFAGAAAARPRRDPGAARR